MELGIVDFNEPAATQVATMAAACTKSGFFRIPLSVVDPYVTERAWETASEFFALSTQQKSDVGFPEPGYPYGYSAFGAETLARSLGDTNALPDLKESLSVGPDCAAPAVATPETARGIGEAWIRSPSLWPEAIADLRPAWEAYYRALSSVAAQLMSVMAVALELPANYFDRLIDRPITSMRAIHYPATPSAPGPALRAGAHSDYGTLTILRTDDVEGLQVRADDGSWKDIEPDPRYFIVNLGDSIAQWTNDRWRSTVHRVVPSSRARQSFAFFHMANWDATIKCLPTCIEPGARPNHDPVQAGPWLMGKFQSTVG